MKLVILFSLLAVGLAHFETYEDFVKDESFKTVSDYANSLGFKTFDQQFLKFKLDHSRSYESEEHESRKKFTFLKNLQLIEKNNELYKKGEVTIEMGVGPFADMTQEEYLATFTMPKPIPTNNTSPLPEIPAAGLPASFDWRASGKVTPVKNQGQCGSCWAFTTNAMIESGYLIYHNQRVSLSEQQLVDCLNTNCGGYYIDRALDYVAGHGVEQSSAYPYTARAGGCRFNGNQWRATIRGHTNVATGGVANQNTIMNAIQQHGPVGIMFDAEGADFSNYRGGVLTTGKNEWKAVHAVTIVGWGTENNIPYWIIKNSWGTGWGDGGFFKMARGRDLRGCEQYVYYPNF